MERTFQTESYQDPAEVFDKQFSWNVVYPRTEVDQNTPIHVIADDWSGREISLPLGVIVEIADTLCSSAEN